MKKTVAILIASVIVLTVWAVTIGRFGESNQSMVIDKYVGLAENQAAKGAYGSAVKCYQRAIELEDRMEYRFSLADACLQYGDRKQYIEVLDDTIRLYPESAEAYEKLAAYYRSVSEFTDCRGVVLKAQEAGVVNETLSALYKQSAYRYTIRREEYDSADSFVNGYAIVCKKGSVYYVNDRLEPIKDAEFDACDVFFGNTAAVIRNEESFFIDKNGVKYLVPDENYTELYSFSQGLAAVRFGEWYGYINTFGERKPGKYEYASSFSGGFAAVKTGGTWRLINLRGEAVTKEDYEDIKRDDHHTIGKGGRYFAQSGNDCMMIDSNGKRIGKELFEDAKPFAGDSMAAYKSDGKWGFVGADGVIRIQACYEDARSFCKGLAAVKKDGKWGYIDAKNVMVIENVFQDAKDFSECKKAPVKVNQHWSFISLRD